MTVESRAPQTRFPQTVFVNGTTFDGDAASRAGVAVSDGVVSAVGPDAELRELAGAGTEIVDLAGGMVLPGFVDAHIHPIEAGIERSRCDLAALQTREEYLAAIRAYAEASPAETWIRGGGWQVAAFPGGTPLATDLDRVVPDRPVVLSNRDHHGVWLNSLALRLAGITKDTPDPRDGRIERAADGSPSGTLHEGARLLVQRVMPVTTRDEERRGLLEAQEHLFSLGVTGWQDAIVGNYGDFTDTAGLYIDAALDGSLKSTVVGALWWDRTRGLEQVADLRERRAASSHPRFRATSVKIMQDGIPENRTAAMIDPYLTDGCACAGDTGISFVDPALLRDAVVALDRDGFQVHMHAIGDRAVREGLDAFERALNENGTNDNRHHIAHLQIVHPDDVPRFGTLGVSANLQALWATFEPQMVELNMPVLGDERTSWQYPFAALAATGARFCAGSDWPVTDPNPWAAIHVAVNRRQLASSPDYTERAFYPENALDLATILSAYTAGSNRINHRDGVGRLVVGAEADLVVVDRDPFAGAPEEIGETRTVGTWVRGERVY